MKQTMMTATLAVLLPLSLAAQAMIDTNEDGLVSLDELQAVFPEVDSDAFMQADSDGDALLNMDELAAAQEAGLIPVQEG